MSVDIIKQFHFTLQRKISQYPPAIAFGIGLYLTMAIRYGRITREAGILSADDSPLPGPGAHGDIPTLEEDQRQCESNQRDRQ